LRNHENCPSRRKALLKEIDEEYEDMLYWLSRPPQERIAEVTRLIHLTLKPGQRMDKTIVVRRQLHSENDDDNKAK